jgi:hypothetical protein
VTIEWCHNGGLRKSSFSASEASPALVPRFRHSAWHPPLFPRHPISTTIPTTKIPNFQNREPQRRENAAQEVNNFTLYTFISGNNATIACDQCRKTKSKCQRVPGSSECKNCITTNQSKSVAEPIKSIVASNYFWTLECTFLGPWQGY